MSHTAITPAGAIGTARPRVEGRGKVTGAVRYAADEQLPGQVFGALVLATVSRGRIREIDTAAVTGMPGVLGVVDHTNAPRLNPEAGDFFGPDRQLLWLQDEVVHYAGQPVALVVAETFEQATAAAQALPVTYDDEPHDLSFSLDHPARRPVVPIYDFGSDATKGDVDAELAASAVVVDRRYLVPEANCTAIEPHSATAWWEGDRLEAIDTNQGPFHNAAVLATLFNLPLDRVRVRAEHVGGGFGGKGPLGPQLVLATMATTLFERPVRVTLSRDQVFLGTVSRAVIDQRVQLGADADGRLRAVVHDAACSISPLAEYLENCTEPAKTLYAANAIRTKLYVVPVDALPPCSMRGPGATPGSFALESAMDELAEHLGMDPLELRLRNEPDVGPVSGRPFGSRNLVACLREGAARFGWAGRDRRPRQRTEGRLLVGTGLAAVSFGAGALPSTASVTAEADGTYTVQVGAVDIGTGARTALMAVAVDALGVAEDRIRLEIADSTLGYAWAASGSRGTTSWSLAIVSAVRKLREQLGGDLPVTAAVDTTDEVMSLPQVERHSFSAVFAEVTVDPATGEIRVRRLLGMFAVGQVINPLMVRSQLVGGMTMGLSMALHEEGVRDRNTGRLVNGDLAGYHIAAHADVPDIEVDVVPDHEPDMPSGMKGAGEIGTVGTAAAIANAVWHATGRRHYELPLRLDRVLEEDPGFRAQLGHGREPSKKRSGWPLPHQEPTSSPHTA